MYRFLQRGWEVGTQSYFWPQCSCAETWSNPLSWSGFSIPSGFATTCSLGSTQSGSHLTLIRHTRRTRRLRESDERERLQKNWVRIKEVETHKSVVGWMARISWEQWRWSPSDCSGSAPIALVLSEDEQGLQAESCLLAEPMEDLLFRIGERWLSLNWELIPFSSNTLWVWSYELASCGLTWPLKVPGRRMSDDSRITTGYWYLELVSGPT